MPSIPRKLEIETLLRRGATLTRYLAAYGGSAEAPIRELPSEGQTKKIVEQVFQLHYRLAEYICALIFSGIMIFVLVALAFLLAGIPLGLPEDLKVALYSRPAVRNIVAGGVGALVWSIYELIERYRSRDLPADGFFAVGLRILVVGTVSAIIGVVVNDNVAAPLSFGIGALPLNNVLDYITRRTRKQLGISEPSAIQSDPSFNSLQGWNADVSQRLARAGVSTLQALACANQFELYLRSSLDWRIILDMSDQALLILYVGDRIQALRPFGIRSAVELAQLDWSEGEEYFEGINREMLLERLGKALGLEDVEVRHLIRSVSNDATVNFLASLWSDATPSEEDDIEEEPDEPTEGRAGVLSGA